MTKYRINAKIDNNQNDIVRALRQIPGVTVALNKDDILVGHQGLNYWFELKDPSQISKKTEKPLLSAYKPSQIALLASWTGHYKIVWTLNQILKEIGL